MWHADADSEAPIALFSDRDQLHPSPSRRRHDCRLQIARKKTQPAERTRTTWLRCLLHKVAPRASDRRRHVGGVNGEALQVMRTTTPGA